MRNGFFLTPAGLAGLLAGAGLAVAGPPAAPVPVLFSLPAADSAPAARPWHRARPLAPKSAAPAAPERQPASPTEAQAVVPASDAAPSPTGSAPSAPAPGATWKRAPAIRATAAKGPDDAAPTGPPLVAAPGEADGKGSGPAKPTNGSTPTVTELPPAVAGPPPETPVTADRPAAPAPVVPDPAAAPPACSSGCTDVPADHHRLAFSGESLLWWFKKVPEPVPLATTVPPGTAFVPGLAAPGALGGPGTRVLLGGSAVDLEEHAGGRFTLEYWLDDGRTFGVEGSYFFLGERLSRQAVGTGGGVGAPQLFIPFTDVIGFTTGGVPGPSVNPGVVGGFPGTIPGLTRGSAALTVADRLQGGEGNGLVNVVDGGRLRVDLLAGFRYLNFLEDLTFTTHTETIPGIPFQPFFADTQDVFRARNDFYGGQLGARAGWNAGAGLSVSAEAKVALGDMNERVDVSGSTSTNIVTAGAGPIVFPGGGLFAQPTNLGSHAQDRFAVVPEVDLRVGYQVTDLARVFVGYTALYVSDVARPGEQINPNINLARTAINQALIVVPIEGPAEPSFRFRTTDFWAQGVSFGLELRY